MKISAWIKGFAIVSLMMLAFNVQAMTTDFPITLQLGGEQWALGNHQEDDNLELAEYVSGSEDVNNWTQLVTFQIFKFTIRPEITPAMFAEKEVEPLKEQNYKFKLNILEFNASEAMMEFRVEEPLSQQQDEIQRIIKTKDNKLIVLHYVIKKMDMGQEARQKWISILKNLDLPFIPKNN